MSVTTGRSAIDASGNVFVYQPPNAGLVNRGNNIVNGTYNQIQAGDPVTWPAGVIQIPGGSGLFDATGPLTYQPVTIVPGPVLDTGTQPGLEPQTTGRIGISAAPAGFVYTPPTAPQIPVGSQVTYGAVVTIDVGQSMPASGIFAIQAGAAPVIPQNLGLYRTVTITPL